jgi:hypothetical protein
VSNHHPIDEDLSLGAPAYTQTPGATPRKDSRIPESRPRVNEKANKPPVQKRKAQYTYRG